MGKEMAMGGETNQGKGGWVGNNKEVTHEGRF